MVLPLRVVVGLFLGVEILMRLKPYLIPQFVLALQGVIDVLPRLLVLYLLAQLQEYVLFGESPVLALRLPVGMVVQQLRHLKQLFAALGLLGLPLHELQVTILTLPQFLYILHQFGLFHSALTAFPMLRPTRPHLFLKVPHFMGVVQLLDDERRPFCILNRSYLLLLIPLGPPLQISLGLRPKFIDSGVKEILLGRDPPDHLAEEGIPKVIALILGVRLGKISYLDVADRFMSIDVGSRRNGGWDLCEVGDRLLGDRLLLPVDLITHFIYEERERIGKESEGKRQGEIGEERGRRRCQGQIYGKVWAIKLMDLRLYVSWQTSPLILPKPYFSLAVADRRLQIEQILLGGQLLSVDLPHVGLQFVDLLDLGCHSGLEQPLQLRRLISDVGLQYLRVILEIGDLTLHHLSEFDQI